MAIAFIEKNESDKYLSVFDYVQAYFDGVHKSEMIFLSTSLLSYVPTNAFEDCTKLKSVMLPNAKFINEFGFNRCTALEYVNISQVSQIGSSAFENCNSLEYIKADRCKTIYPSAFYNCYNLSEYIFGDVNLIGEYAFYNCSHIEVAQFNKCQTLLEHCFDGCANLSIVSFDNCTTVGERALANCTSLSILSLPNCIRLWSGALYGCNNLISVYLNSFGNSNQLPCDYVFEGCNNLDAIYLPSISLINSSIVTSLYKVVMSGITLIDDASRTYYSSFNIKNLDLPNLIEVRTMSKGSPFIRVSYLKADKLVSIGSNIFSNCYDLQYIDLPNLKYITGSLMNLLPSISYINVPKIESYIISSATSILSTVMINIPTGARISYINLNGLKVAQYPSRSANTAYGFIRINSSAIINDLYLNSLEHIDQYGDLGIHNYNYNADAGRIKNLYLNGIKSIYKNALLSDLSSTNFTEGYCIAENIYLRNCSTINNIIEHTVSSSPGMANTFLFNNAYINSIFARNYYLDECLEFNFYWYYSDTNYKYYNGEITASSIYAPKLETIYASFVGYPQGKLQSFYAPNLKYGMLKLSDPYISILDIPLFEGSYLGIFGYYGQYQSPLEEINIKGSSDTVLYLDDCYTLKHLNILGSQMSEITLNDLSDLRNINCSNLELCNSISIYYGLCYFSKLYLPKLSGSMSTFYIGGVTTIKEFYAPKLDKLPTTYRSSFYFNVESITTGIVSIPFVLNLSKTRYFSASCLTYISNSSIIFNSSIIEFINVQNVEHIGSSVFSNLSCISIMNIPKCSYIGNCAFYRCSNLSIINLDNCEYIGNYAFTYCSNLKVLMLPKCSYIGGSALFSVPIELIELGYGSVLSVSMFNKYSNFVVKVPASLYSAYQADSAWMALSSTRSIYIVSD